MSIGKYILIDPSECPSREELIDGIERLLKCSVILSKFKSKNDPCPESLRRVASFLELIHKDNRLKQNKLSDEDEISASERIAEAKNKKKG